MMTDKIQRVTSNIPKPLLNQVEKHASELWGEQDSTSGVVLNVLRDWLSQTNRGVLENRLDLLERRTEHLLRSTQSETRVSDNPSLAETDVCDRLGLSPRKGLSGVGYLQEKPKPSAINAMGVKLVRAHRRDKSKQFGIIPPEYLLGYDPAGTIDFQAYERIGFPLLRDVETYSLNNPDMKQFVEACLANPKVIYNPILIYYCNNNLIVLDGIARLVALVEAQKQGIARMMRIFVELFVGDQNSAKQEVILRNLHGGLRPLTRVEFIRWNFRH